MRPSSTDLGLLIIRVGIGIAFIAHGLPKITGGPEMWVKVGSAMQYVGINFGHVVWGFLASFAETFGALFLILGVLFRPACAMLSFTMLIAMIFHLMNGDGFNGASHAIESMIVFIGLGISGSGFYSLIKPKKKGYYKI